MTGPTEVFPRSLSPREAEVLDFILSVDDPRLAPLRAQRESAVVTGTCGCGCASIDLAVDRARSRPAQICRQPIEANLNKTKAALPDANEYYGLLLFLDEGWLSLLEIWWHEKPPPEFPPVTSFYSPEVTCERDEAALAAFGRSSTRGALAENARGRLRGAARGIQRLLGRPPTE